MKFISNINATELIYLIFCKYQLRNDYPPLIQKISLTFSVNFIRKRTNNFNNY